MYSLNSLGVTTVKEGKDILTIVPMSQPNYYALGIAEYGVKLIKLYKEGGFQVHVSPENYLKGLTICDINEYMPGFLLCVSYFDCTYH